MKTIGSYELKTHLSQILKAVEHGETVIIARHGKAIARLCPDGSGSEKRAQEAVAYLLKFPRTPLPKGVTIRHLIEHGRE